jgi:divalent metal cation (Fe/Co/Zn/Cd) transporter
MDACSCTEIVSDIENIAKNVAHVKNVHSVRLRKIGPYVMGDMRVEVDGEMTVNQAHEIKTEIEEKVKHEFDEVAEIKVRVEPIGTQDKQKRTSESSNS